MFPLTFNKRNITIYAILVLYIALILNVTNSWITVSFYQWLPLLVIIPCGISDLIRLIKYNKISSKLITTYNLFIFPFVIPTIIATITAFFVYHETRYTLSSIRTALYPIMAILLGYYLIRKLDRKIIPIIMIAGTISYMTVIIQFFLGGGLNPFLPAPNGISLEVHELTYIYGICFVYFILSKDIALKSKKIGGVVSLIGIILGDKRALYLALGIGFFCYYLFHKILNNKKRGLKFVALICTIVAFVFIYVVQSGWLELLFSLYGINDMSRFKMWDLFRNDYSLSLFYWGKGVTYTDVILADSIRLLQFSKAITLHNDILRIYIGWGFLPFCYFVYKFIYQRTTKFLNINKTDNAWAFLALAIVYYIINFFGNTFFREGICMVFYIMWYSLFYGFKNKNTFVVSNKN